MPLIRDKQNAAYTYWCRQVLNRLKRRDPDGKPSFLYYEPSSGCNLECPACPTGTHPELRTRKQARLEEFEIVLDALGDTLLQLELYNWGEPFLHKKLPDFVRLAHDRSIHTALSTNFSFRNLDDRIAATLHAGLGSLKVGLDGFSQAVHETYRRGSDVELVKRNLATAARIRDEGGLATEIFAAFLVFEHNVHELAELHAFCKEIGVALQINQTPLTAPGAGIDAAAGASRDIRDLWSAGLRDAPLPTRGCTWLYHAAVINPNLSVSPCCAIADETDDFLHLDRDRLAEEAAGLLNAAPWRAARAYVDGLSEAEHRTVLTEGARIDQTDPGLTYRSTGEGICGRCPIGLETFKYHGFGPRMKAMLLNEVARVPLRDETDKNFLMFKLLVCDAIDFVSNSPVAARRLPEFEALCALLDGLTTRGVDERATLQSLGALVQGLGAPALLEDVKLLVTPLRSISIRAQDDARAAALRAQDDLVARLTRPRHPEPA